MSGCELLTTRAASVFNAVQSAFNGGGAGHVASDVAAAMDEEHVKEDDDGSGRDRGQGLLLKHRRSQASRDDGGGNAHGDPSAENDTAISASKGNARVVLPAVCRTRVKVASDSLRTTGSKSWALGACCSSGIASCASMWVTAMVIAMLAISATTASTSASVSAISVTTAVRARRAAR